MGTACRELGWWNGSSQEVGIENFRGEIPPGYRKRIPPEVLKMKQLWGTL